MAKDIKKLLKSIVSIRKVHINIFNILNFLYKSLPKISERGTAFVYKMYSMSDDISFKFQTQRLTLTFIRQL